MTEEEYKNIQAPSKEQISEKRKKANSAILSVIGNILNLAFAFMIACILIFLTVKVFAGPLSGIQSDFLRRLISLWIPVIIGIAGGFFIQHGLIWIIIRVFKLEDKLEDSFLSHYRKKEK